MKKNYIKPSIKIIDEIFKTIDGANNYQISNFGRIKSVRFNKILKGGSGVMGHIQVLFKTNDGTSKRDYIHRLVAKAFIPNPENKPEVDHIDCNPSNNYYFNLKWATRKENANNPLSIEHYKIANSIKMKKLWNTLEYRNKNLNSRNK